MAGGVAVISTFGPQDAYLTVNPEITLFKELYSRHTPFGRELKELTMNGNPNFGNTGTCEIERNGDLVGEMFLRVTTPVLTGTATQAWVRELMHFITKHQECTVTGNRIDKIYGFMYSSAIALTLKEEKKAGYADMIGDTADMTQEQASIASKTLYLPLRFWFNMRPGSYIPLIAVSRHKIHIQFEFEDFQKLYKTSTSSVVTQASLINPVVLTNYMYLDAPERRQFARVAHEYLINVHQFSGVETNNGSTATVSLDSFHHPVIEFISVLRLQSEEDAKNWYRFTDASGDDLIDSLQFQLNGEPYENLQNARWNSLCVPFLRHTNIPVGEKKQYINDIALHPEEFQPSSSVNMSRASSARMNYNLKSNAAVKIYCYAISKNVVRIISGLMGPAYQN